MGVQNSQIGWSVESNLLRNILKQLDRLTKVASTITGGEVTVPDASEATKGIAELANQTEINTGTDDSRIITALKLKNLDSDPVALVDAASMALTGPKHTLTTSSATRTFTISHIGDDIILIITLNALTSVFTFPATSLCVSDGIATGNNTLTLNGVSGDKYMIGIKKVGSAYYVVSKNFGQ